MLNQNKSVFLVPDKYFYSSLIFVKLSDQNTLLYPSNLWAFRENIRLGWIYFVNDKHSSLFCQSVRDEEKRFSTFAPVCRSFVYISLIDWAPANLLKLFFLRNDFEQNKLTCLLPRQFFKPAQHLRAWLGGAS
jgi:hypothetical protein